MRRANAQLQSVRGAAILAAAQRDCVRATLTETHPCVAHMARECCR
jgi:hypothetical protein